MIKHTKILILIFIFTALASTLCACAQSQINVDRFPSSENAESLDLSGSDADRNDESDNALGKYVETDKVFEQDDFFGYGHVNFYVNDIKLADNMNDAGIDEAIYQLSGYSTYDYYIAVSLTIENIDVPVDGNAVDIEYVKFPLINHFRLHTQSEDENRVYNVKYFDLGGVANPDEKRYFQYELPKLGETMDVTIAFGMSREDVSAIKANNESLYLSCDEMTGMMAIEGIL